MKGKIKFFNSMRGYGFIIMEDNKEIFFHMSEFPDQEETMDLMADDKVEFEVEGGRRGNKAVKIKLIK